MAAAEITLYAYINAYYKGKYYNHAPHQRSRSMSLATCVWQIRKAAEKGDWVIGLLAVNGHPEARRLISFLFRVDKIIGRAIYFKAYSKVRFDNYYVPTNNVEFQLLPNR